VPANTAALLRHFREEFRKDPAAAYRDWFRLQEELRDSDDPAAAKALAEDLWTILEELSFSSKEDRARFFHNVAVFFGTTGPAADLARARKAFAVALEHFGEHDDAGWHARVLHNFGTSLSNLGKTAEDLEESVSLFERALEWRTLEREIARGVTLHNLGIALRRLSSLDRDAAAARLNSSAAVLREAAEIRDRRGLAEGYALTLFHLGLTLEALERTDEARDCFSRSADAFTRLGKLDSAAVAMERADRL
jgi:tetratricopeptide (TPR) repeat protein